MFNISYYLILTKKKCTTKNVSMFHEIYDLYLLSEKLNINFTFLKEFPPILIITSLGRSLATSFWYIIHNHENQSFITKFLCQVHTTLVSAKAWFYTNWLNPVFFTSFWCSWKFNHNDYVKSCHASHWEERMPEMPWFCDY